MLGQEYHIISVESSGLVEVGSELEHTDLQPGDTVEQGPFEVEVVDFDREDNTVRVTVYEDGERLDSATLGEDGNTDATDSNEETFGDDNEFEVHVESVFFGSNTDDVILETVHSDSELESGEDFPWDENYTVDTITLNDDEDAVEGVTLRNNVETAMPADNEDESDFDEDQVPPLQEGESFAGPLDYFTVDYHGFTDEQMTDITFNEDQEVNFTDENAFEVSLDATELTGFGSIGNSYDFGGTASSNWYLGVPDGDVTSDDTNYYPVQITTLGDSGETLELAYEAWDYEFDVDADDVDGNLTVTDDASGTGDIYDHVSGTVAATDAAYVVHDTVSTGYEFSVTVEWIDIAQDGSTDSVNVYGTGYDSGQVPTGGSEDLDQNSRQAQEKVSTEFGAEMMPLDSAGDASDQISDGGSVTGPSMSHTRMMTMYQRHCRSSTPMEPETNTMMAKSVPSCTTQVQHPT